MVFEQDYVKTLKATEEVLCALEGFFDQDDIEWPCLAKIYLQKVTRLIEKHPHLGPKQE